MPQETLNSQQVNPEYGPSQQPDLCYDPDNILLEGHYPDELSAHRARKVWSEVLKVYFLLEGKDDFALRVSKSPNLHQFTLTCTFFSACARYAFWRLTNEQAPEAQYRIETAHIPNGESQFAEFVSAPDLHSVHDGPLIFQGWGKRPSINTGWINRLKEVFEQLKRQ